LHHCSPLICNHPHGFQNTSFFLLWQQQLKAKISSQRNCVPDVGTGTESKSKQIKFTCRSSFPAKERSATLLTARLLFAWLETLLFQGLYFSPLTISQIKRVGMKLPNVNKNLQSRCCSFRHPARCLLHLNAAEDTFMPQWWSYYNAHTAQERRKTSRVLLSVSRKSYST